MKNLKSYLFFIAILLTINSNAIDPLSGRAVCNFYNNIGPQPSTRNFSINVEIINSDSTSGSIIANFEGLFKLDGTPVSGFSDITLEGNRASTYNNPGIVTIYFKPPFDYNNILNDFTLIAKFSYYDFSDYTDKEFFTNSFTINIDDNPPTTPTPYVVGSPIYSNTSIVVKWPKCSDVDGGTVNYKAYLIYDGNIISTKYGCSNNTCTFTEIKQQCKDYYIVVTSIDRFDHEAESSPLKVTIKGDILPNPIIRIKNNNTQEILSLTGSFCYVPFICDIEAKIYNYDSNARYTFSYSSDKLTGIYGGSDYRSYRTLASSGSGHITVSMNKGCSDEVTTIKNIFVKYNRQAPWPTIGGYATPHFTDNYHTYFIQNTEALAEADVFDWEIYDSNNNLIYSSSSSDPSIDVFIGIPGIYSIKARTYSNAYEIPQGNWQTMIFQVYR